MPVMSQGNQYWLLGHSHSRQLTLMLGKSPRSKGDIRVKLNLTTQALLYTKTDGPCTAVT